MCTDSHLRLRLSKLLSKWEEKGNLGKRGSKAEVKAIMMAQEPCSSFSPIPQTPNSPAHCSVHSTSSEKKMSDYGGDDDVGGGGDG